MMSPTTDGAKAAMDETPRSLLERLRDRPDDRAAWERLLSLYQPWIRRCFAHGGLQDADRDDLTQEVLAVLVREMPRFDHSEQRGAFRHWLRRIIDNRLRRHWSDLKPVDGAVDPDDLADPYGDLARLWDAEHDQFVARGLMELIEPEFSPTTWRAFRRQVLDDRRAAEVAAELALSVNAVLIAKSRVLRRLHAEGRGLLG